MGEAAKCKRVGAAAAKEALEKQLSLKVRAPCPAREPLLCLSCPCLRSCWLAVRNVSRHKPTFCLAADPFLHKALEGDRAAINVLYRKLHRSLFGLPKTEWLARFQARQGREMKAAEASATTSEPEVGQGRGN